MKKEEEEKLIEIDKGKAIMFSYNWNNKLDCDAFTSLRVSNKYKVGDIYRILLVKKDKKGNYIIVTDYGHAKTLAVKKFEVGKLNDFIAYLDTGYSKEETIEILKRMYKWDSVKGKMINLILFVKLKEDKNAKPKRSKHTARKTRSKSKAKTPRAKS